MADLGEELAARVRAAHDAHRPLRLVGSGSKDFLANTLCGEPLRLAGHDGIVRYEPRELVIRARAATRLAEIEALLAENGQMLAFEPPAFAPDATLGGTIACGLSGPRRPFAGAARDFVLGARIVDGRGETLRFGGEVMKNVAGYDVSRLMVGAFGTLGLLLDVSLKVLPLPRAEVTLRQSLPLEEALARMNRLAVRPLPLSAACWLDGVLWLRLSGAEPAVESTAREIGGERIDDGADFWRALREQRLEFFTPAREGASRLWRLSLPPTRAPLALPGAWLIDWGGAQRWLLGEAPPAEVWHAASEASGHATCFRGPAPDDGRFQPLSPPLRQLHRRLKQVFDPRGILNPGRQYPEF